MWWLKTDYFIDCHRIGDALCLKYRDKDHVAHFERIKYHPTLYYPTENEPDSVYRTLDGRPVEAVSFETMRLADEYKEEQRTPAHGNINPINAYLVKRFPELPQVDLSNLLVAWIDIEVDISEGVSEPEDAKNEVLSIAIRKRGHSHLFGVKPYVPKRSDVTYVQCADETELLEQFLEYWTTEYPDIVSGWYIDGFDLVYLINRIDQILGKEAKRLLSPWKSIRTVKSFVNGKPVESYEITGVAILDGLALYKKFSLGQKSSYTLDAIAEEVLGERKVAYADDYESLARLYRENSDLFYDYNLVDVDLPERIDAKLKYLAMVVSMAHDARVNFGDTLKQTRMWDSMIYRYLLDRNIVVPPESTAPAETLLGAYVKDTLVGKFGWVVSFDVASLYPSLMRQWSISPDTFIDPEWLTTRLQSLQDALQDDFRPSEGAEWVEAPGAWRTAVPTEVPKTVLAEWSDALIQMTMLRDSATGVMLGWLADPVQSERVRVLCQRMHVTITPNGQMFDTSRSGFMGAMLTDLIVGRQFWKKKQLALETEAVGQTGDQKAQTLTAARVAETVQATRKILLNAAYGATGNEHFRYFDVRLAGAVTASGQMLIQYVEQQVNAALNRWLDTTGSVDGKDVDYVVASDTDSIYITLDRLVQKHCGSSTPTPKIVEAVDKFCQGKIQPILNDAFGHIFETLCGHESVIAMKREAIADAAIFLRKKRYFLNIWDKEGVRYIEPKMKITGMESVRSTVPKVARDGFKKAYEVMLRASETQLWDLVNAVRKQFETEPFDLIAKSSSVPDMMVYAAEPISTGACDLSGVVVMSSPYRGKINKNDKEAGCPIHIRAALLYNYMLRKTKLDGKYTKIQPGIKIKYAYLKEPNPIGENVIGTPKTLPPEWDLDGYVDRTLQFEKTFREPLERILDEIGWTVEPVVSSSLF